MSLKNKRANIVTDNTVELIIAAAGIVVLVFLLFALYSPTYDENAETAKSYMESLQKAMKQVEKGEIGEFEIWYPEEGTHFMMVYFGDKRSYTKWKWGEGRGLLDNWEIFFNFFSIKGKNRICICYGDSTRTEFRSDVVVDAKCKYCTELKYPASFGNFKDLSLFGSDDSVEFSEYGMPIFAKGNKVFIRKFDNEYFFSRDGSNLPVRIDYNDFNEKGMGEPHPEFICREFQEGATASSFPPVSFRYMGAWEITSDKDLNAETKWITFVRNPLDETSWHGSFMEFLRYNDISLISSTARTMGEALYNLRLDFEAGKKLLIDSQAFECPGQKIELRLDEPLKGEDLLSKFLNLKVFLFSNKEKGYNIPKVFADLKSAETALQEFYEGGEMTGLGSVQNYVVKDIFNNCKFEGLNETLFFEGKKTEDSEGKEVVEYGVDIRLGSMLGDANEILLDADVKANLDAVEQEPLIYYTVSENEKFTNGWPEGGVDMVRFKEFSEPYGESINKEKLCSGDFDLYVVHRGMLEE